MALEWKRNEVSQMKSMPCDWYEIDDGSKCSGITANDSLMRVVSIIFKDFGKHDDDRAEWTVSIYAHTVCTVYT